MSSSEPTGKRKYSFNFNTMIGAFLIVLGLIVLALIPYQVEQPLRLVGETTKDLDPALFPRIIAVLTSLIGIVLFVISFSMNEHNNLTDVTGLMAARVAISLVLIFSYALLMRPLGFVFASAVVVGILSTIYGNRSIIAGLVASILIPLLMFNLFTNVLKVSLPEFPIFLGLPIL